MDKIKAAEEVQAINGTLLLTELLKRADEKNDNGQPVIRDIEDNIGGMTKYVRYDAMVFELNKLLKAALSTQSPKWVQCHDGNKYLTVNNILCFVSNEGDGCIEADGGGSRFLLAKNEDGSFYVANSMNGFGENTHKEFASAKVVLLTPIESSSTHPLQEKIDGLRGFMARIYTFVSKDVQDLIKQALETYK